MPCSLPNLMSLIDGIIILILKHQLFLGSIVVSISACHAEDRGSIPRQGGHDFVFVFLPQKAFKPSSACSYTKTDNTIRFYIELLT